MILNMIQKILITFADRANAAVNAAIVQQAADARYAMAAQALAACREMNNPFIPGNSLFGPSRAQMFGPDPCQTEMNEMQNAAMNREAALLTAQTTAAPTPAAPHAAAAPQLSETVDIVDLLDPTVPETEFVVPSPTLSNMWSPDSIEEAMIRIAQQLEQDGNGPIRPEDVEEMDLIFENMTQLLNWWCWVKPKRQRKRYKFLPKNQSWIGKWTP